MPYRGRMLVGLDGRNLDERVIRYAAMVARSLQPIHAYREFLRSNCAPGSLRSRGEDVRTTVRQSHVADCATVATPAENCFVSVLERHVGATAAQRAALATKLSRHFPYLDLPIDVRSDLLKGRAMRRLAALAADCDSDLLLVDESLGPRRGWARFSIAAPASVWLVPRAWAPVMRRILVPVDYTAQSAVALQAAVDLARCFPPATCIALHVVRNVSRLQSPAIPPARGRELLRELDDFASQIDAQGVRIEPLLLAGNRLSRAIEHAARQCPADLTVLAARRRSPLAAWLCPSEAEAAVRHCPGPILLLRSADLPLGVGDAVQRYWQQAESLQFG